MVGILAVLIIGFLVPSFFSVKCPAQSYLELTFERGVETGPISGAIFSNPALGDFDGDGIMDLILATRHHGQGIFYYRGNPWEKGRRLFEQGIRLDLPSGLISAVDWNSDGLTDLMTRTKRLVVRLNQGGNPPEFGDAIELLGASDGPIAELVEYATVMASPDSKTVITGRNDFEGHWPKGRDHRTADIGFWRGYDSFGIWKGRENLVELKSWKYQFEGGSFQLKNTAVLFGEHTLLQFLHGASPISADVDNDGDQDLLIADFNGDFSLAWNIGSNAQPEFQDSVHLLDTDGSRFRSEQCFVYGQGIDWNQDEWEDLVYGCEDGFVYVCLNLKRHPGTPAFGQPLKVIAKKPPLDVGVTASPWIIDLDRNGEVDLLVGNAAGSLLTFMNSGNFQEPAFTEEETIKINEIPFRIQAGYNGSIQGPAEATWGYISPSTCDVDGDGDEDILYSDITGFHHVLLNPGSFQSPLWSVPISVKVGGQPLRTVWRTSPIMTDWNKDGALDYVCLNEKGEMGHYAGTDPLEWNSFADWVSWKFEDGTSIDPDGVNGMEGRAKICLSDWDLDGRKDLLIGIKGGTKWSSSYGRSDLTYIVFLKNLSSNRRNVFDIPRPIRFKNGKDIEMGDHTACPEVVAFYGDTDPGLLIGCENGRLYYFSRRELTW